MFGILQYKTVIQQTATLTVTSATLQHQTEEQLQKPKRYSTDITVTDLRMTIFPTNRKCVLGTITLAFNFASV